MVQAGEVTAAKDFINSFSFGDRTRSFLKVQTDVITNALFVPFPC
ncbi:MAG: hypothetical protein R2784_07430 [Saprospiraceae bacterium]